MDNTYKVGDCFKRIGDHRTLVQLVAINNNRGDWLNDIEYECVCLTDRGDGFRYFFTSSALEAHFTKYTPDDKTLKFFDNLNKKLPPIDTGDFVDTINSELIETTKQKLSSLKTMTNDTKLHSDIDSLIDKLNAGMDFIQIKKS